MRCFAITKYKCSRCKNTTNFIFCKKHKGQWIGLIIFLIITIPGAISSYKSIFPIKEDNFNNLTLKDTTKDPNLFLNNKEFKILILPIKNISNKTTTDYGSMIRDKLENENKSNGSNAYIYYFQEYKYPNIFNDSVINELLINTNSNLIVWGDFITNNGKDYLSIKYTTSNWKNLQNSNSQMTPLTINGLSNGETFGEIEYIFNYINGIISFQLSGAKNEGIIFISGNKLVLPSDKVNNKFIQISINSFKYLLSNKQNKLIDDSIFNFLGVCYLLNNQYNLSITYFKLYFENNKNNAIAYENIALSYLLSNKIDSSIYYYNLSIKSPSNRQYIRFFNRGAAYDYKNDFVNAKKDYLKSLSINKNYLLPYVSLAVIYSIEKKYDSAHYFANSALKLSPNNSEALYAKSRIFKSNKETDSAINYINKSVYFNPNNPWNFQDRSELYLEKALNEPNNQQYWINLAFQDISKIIEENPTTVEFYVTRGKCYNGKNEFEKSINDYLFVLKSEPKNHEALYGIAMSYNGLNNFQKSIEFSTQLIASYPNESQGYFLRANNYYQAKQFILAIKDFTSAINREPNKYIYYYNRGLCHCELGKLKECKEDINYYYNQSGIKDPQQINLLENKYKIILNK